MVAVVVVAVVVVVVVAAAMSEVEAASSTINKGAKSLLFFPSPSSFFLSFFFFCCRKLPASSTSEVKVILHKMSRGQVAHKPQCLVDQASHAWHQQAQFSLVYCQTKGEQNTMVSQGRAHNM